MLAVEMSSPIHCNFPPLLNPATPPLCARSQTVLSENWESGAFGSWTLASVGEKNNAAGMIVAQPGLAGNELGDQKHAARWPCRQGSLRHR